MQPRYYIPVLTFFPLLLLQITVVPLISIKGIIPDLLLIAVVYCAISFGQIYGTILGSVYGLLFDLITGSLIGSTMLSKTVAGFVGGYFSSETRREKYLNTYAFALVVFICAICDSVIFSFFSAIDFNTTILNLLFNNALLPSVFTTAISLILVVIPYKRRFV